MAYPYVRDVRGVVLYVREHGSGQWVAGILDGDDNFAAWRQQVKILAKALGCRVHIQRADQFVFVWDADQGPALGEQLALIEAVESSATDEPVSYGQVSHQQRRDRLRLVRDNDSS